MIAFRDDAHVRGPIRPDRVPDDVVVDAERVVLPAAMMLLGWFVYMVALILLILLALGAL